MDMNGIGASERGTENSDGIRGSEVAHPRLDPTLDPTPIQVGDAPGLLLLYTYVRTNIESLTDRGPNYRALLCPQYFCDFGEKRCTLW